MNLDSYLTTYTKITLKEVKFLNTRTKTIKSLEENLGENLHDTGFHNSLLDITVKAQGTKLKNR